MRIVAVIAMMGVALSGCASGLPGLRQLTYQQPGDTRVYASYAPCPHKAGDNFAPVLAAIALEVGSKLINGFGTALSKGAEGGALPASVATVNVEIGKEIPKCLVVIRGSFSPSKPGEKPSALPDGDTKLRLMNTAGEQVDVALPTVYGLQHYIEIQLVSSRNGTAMTFGPAIIYIAQSMDGATTGDRAVSIAVKFERPGHDPIGSVVLISNRRIGDKDAYPVDESRRMQYEAPWFPTIATAEGGDASATDAGTTPTEGSGNAPATPAGGNPPPAPAKAEPAKPAVKPGKVVASAAADAPTAPNGPTPFTITTTVIETRPTKEFLAFVASVFSGVEPQLNDALKDRIDPATRTTNAAAGIDLQTAYTTSFAAAQTAMYEYCALPGTSAKADLISKSAAARIAQLGANKAALSADLKAPFGQLVEVGTGDPASVAACAAYQ